MNLLSLRIRKDMVSMSKMARKDSHLKEMGEGLKRVSREDFKQRQWNITIGDAPKRSRSLRSHDMFE